MNEYVSAKAAQRENILRDKPCLVTLNNPFRTNGPLWPEPEGSPGWRLWQMVREYTGASMNQYLLVFERMCVIDSASWDHNEALNVSLDFLDGLKGRTRVVFVGYDVMNALCIPRRKLDWRWRYDYEFTFTSIPFPTARSKIFVNEVEVALCGVFLADLYQEALQKRAVVIP